MAPVRVLVELLIAGQWVDITGDVYTREDIQISRGRADEGSEVDPGTCSLLLNNRGGTYSPRNPRSPYFGLLGRNTPIRVSVRHAGGTIPRFVGEVAAWPPRWDLSGNDVYVPVEAAGILRRLGASVAPLQSALRRFIEASGPSAYWPLTDGENTDNAASVVGGNIAYLNVSEGDVTQPMQWAKQDLAPHLEPIAVTPDKTFRGVFRGYVLPGHRPREWAIDFIRCGVGGDDGFQIQVAGSGTDADPTVFWGIGFEHYSASMYITYASTGDTQGSTSFVQSHFEIPEAFEADVAHVFRLECTASGSSTRWRLYMDGVQLRTGVYAATPRAPVRWLYEWWTPDGDDLATTVALGHITVWDAALAPDLDGLMVAYHGHAGENAGQRILRVCDEAGLPVTILGDADDTQLVGAQQLESPLDVLSAAAAADGGMLYEDRAEVRLVYRTNRSRYNHGLLLAEEE